jgi:hypothetical protein
VNLGGGGPKLGAGIKPDVQAAEGKALSVAVRLAAAGR